MKEAEQGARHLRAERRFGPDLADIDRVEVSFDWEVPSHANIPLVFHLTITRGNRQSLVCFQVDLQKLAGADLQRLHDLLAERPKGYQLTYEIAWLLGLSLEHEMPESNLKARHQRVRELLLCSENQRTHTI